MLGGPISNTFGALNLPQKMLNLQHLLSFITKFIHEILQRKIFNILMYVYFRRAV